MPTYEYVCRECETRHEVVQSIRDDALEHCPDCGGSLRKVFGNIGIVLKGSGFYRNDSRSSSTSSVSTSTNSDGKSSSSDAKGSSGSEASSSSSSDSKSSSESKSSADTSKASSSTKAAV
jgi:putative FmdB family regulatory protein